MTLPASLAKGSGLSSLTVAHPGKAPPTTSPPIVITLTDSTGRLRARWSIESGQTLTWSDLAGFLLGDDITISASGPVATASGEMHVTTPASSTGGATASTLS